MTRPTSPCPNLDPRPQTAARPKRFWRRGSAVVVLAILAAGCGAEAAAEKAAPPTTQRSVGIGGLSPAKVGVPDDPPENEDGAEIRLDETALLACANVQFVANTIDSDSGADVTADLKEAADRARVSEVSTIRSMAPALDSARAEVPKGASPIVLVRRFLARCASLGFEA